MAPTYRNRNIVPTPADKEEFEKAVHDAVRAIYHNGSRALHIYNVYDITRWQRTASTSHRIGFAFRHLGLVQMAKPNNRYIYKIPPEAVA